MDPVTKINRIRDELDAFFLERTSVVRGALAALVAGEHVLVIGPPGTAKSMLAEQICRRIDGAGYFQWLLTKFTTPEEIFGAVSLKGLSEDLFRRVTRFKLPEAHIAFLDEIFKANSSILNSLLTLINERCFHNGNERVDVPLKTLFGASNELPEEDELLALYDRFLLRYLVDYIGEDFRFIKMITGETPEAGTTLSLAELDALRAAAAEVTVDTTVVERITELRRVLREKGIIASDRRYRRAVGLLKAGALLAGRDHVAEDDLLLLEDVLWSKPEERGDVQEAVRKVVRGLEDDARKCLYQARELRAYAEQDWQDEDMAERALLEVHTKLKMLLERLERIRSEAEARRLPADPLLAMEAEIRGIQKELLQRF